MYVACSRQRWWGRTKAVLHPAAGHTTSFVYDAKDRLVSTTDPLNHATGFGYDVVDNRTVITNSLGYTTTFTYDSVNRQAAVTDALGNKTQYGYDADGNRTSLTDAKGYITTYTLDALGRLVGVTDAVDTSRRYPHLQEVQSFTRDNPLFEQTSSSIVKACRFPARLA
jgi:YD repeat-containing protein